MDSSGVSKTYSLLLIAEILNTKLNSNTLDYSRGAHAIVSV